MSAPLFIEEYRGSEDREGWPAGEWDDEPDKAVWVDDATGLDCMLRRGSGGAWCGYVGVPPGHPWHGLGYSECVEGCENAWECEHSSPERVVSVHGGLTFAAGCREHADPAADVCHVPQPGRPADVWWLGFDCAHAWDLRPGMYALARMTGDNVFLPASDDVYRSMRYVIGETKSLAQQIAKVGR